MLTLPSKFAAELAKAPNTPSFLVKLEDGTLYNEQTLQADWTANSQASQIDFITQVGSVLIESTLRPENLIGDAWAYLSWYGEGPVQAIAWQSFQQTTGATKTLQNIIGFFNRTGNVPYLHCQLFAADKVTPIGTSVSATVTSTAGENITFDFTSQGISISTATMYWIKFYTGAPSAIGIIRIYYSSNSAYSGGLMTLNANPTGDAYFQVNMGGFYKTSGYIRTQTMDIGSTPASYGEWVLEDIVPSGTTLTYQAWASAAGTFTGEETDLGAIVDGQAITNLKRYYRVKATFTANGDQTVSPTLQSIKADFTTFKTYSDNPSLGHETAILSVSSLSSSIDTFKPSTVGQITFSLNLNPSVSNYLATKKPKNKLVQVKAGFVADGFVEADYIDYAWGQIDDWKITAKDEVTLTVKDFSKEWDVDVPKAIEGQLLPEIIWGTPGLNHPIDVMLDILKNHINARDSKILGSSFGTVKTALSGWIVARTLKEDTVSAKELMEELRLLTQTYFLPQANGAIKIKRWDADEAPVDSLTDADFISKRWDSDAKQIINRYVHFYGWDGEGDEAADYGTVSIGIDTTSQANWRETTSQELKDKWTPITQTAQISDFLDKIMKRYADPPSILYADVDLRKMALEVGDIVTVTTSRAPSTDMAGISNIKFQIVNRNLDYSKRILSLTMLECASSVNTQVEPPVAGKTPYDFPDHVVGLAIVEQGYTNHDGIYTPLIIVTYDLPADAAYWHHAIIQTSIDGGLTYVTYGLDYNQGNGYIIDPLTVGGYIGGTFEVRVVSVNINGIIAPFETAPTASLAKIGGVILESPNKIRGLAIEGNSDPNNTEWDGLKFALTWWKASQTGGTGVEGGLGAGGFDDSYWQGDEYEIWVAGIVIDSGITRAARYDYIYGDGYLAHLDAKIAAAFGTVTFQVRRISLNLASEWASITITQKPPESPQNLIASAFFQSTIFVWDMAQETDFSHYKVRTSIDGGTVWTAWSDTPNNRYSREVTIAELAGAGTKTVNIQVRAVDVYNNESGTSSTSITTEQIMPDVMYTSLRVDFLVKDAIFYFGDNPSTPSEGSKTTLYWTVGVISWKNIEYTLSASNLASATAKYVVATCSAGFATLSLMAMTSEPVLTSNQIIIAYTSATANSVGNYLCYVRQANSMMFEGANIRDLTVLDAKIKSLAVSKLVAGSITSQAITLAITESAGDVKIQAGKTDFGDNTAGFIIGIDDSDSNKVKFEIGDATNNMKWNGSTLAINGTFQTSSGGNRFVAYAGDRAYWIDSSDGTLASIGSYTDTIEATIWAQAKSNETGAAIQGRQAYYRAGPGACQHQGLLGDSIHYAGVYGHSSTDHGGVFTCGKAGLVAGQGPIRLIPSTEATTSAPTHSAGLGTLWVTTDGVLYINTNGSTTWGKVGAQ